jgi:hypothetical protein
MVTGGMLRETFEGIITHSHFVLNVQWCVVLYRANSQMGWQRMEAFKFMLYYPLYTTHHTPSMLSFKVLMSMIASLTYLARGGVWRACDMM